MVRNYSFEDNTYAPNCFNSPTPQIFLVGQNALDNYWQEVDYWTCPQRKLQCVAAASADCLCNPAVA